MPLDPQSPATVAPSDIPRWIAPLAIALLGAALWLTWSPLGANEVVGGDEGYYGTMARNVLDDARQLTGPSLTPRGAPGDKPPLYPALLALSIRTLGPTATALRWPSVAAAIAIVLGLAALAARAARTAYGDGAAVVAAAVAAALLVALPWFADSSRVAAAEPLLTALGVGAMVVAAGRPESPRRGAVAGLLLGLAFLCKLWLVALVALPVVVLLWPRRGSGIAPLACAAGAAFGVAALQVAAIAAFAPQSLSHWLGIYFGFSLAGRAGGAGFASGWLQPPGYYAALLAHALVLSLPLVALGVAAALRRWREPPALALLAWALGASVLSAFAVKSGVYAYVVMPAWIGLAALGAAALGSGARPSWLALAIAALAGSPLAIERLGDRELALGPWLGAWALALVMVGLARARPRLAPLAAGVLVAAAVAGGMVREAQRMPRRYHVPGYRTVEAVLAPRLAGRRPEEVAYVTPEAPAFAFHLYRTGRYWGTPGAPWHPDSLPAIAADRRLLAFVVDTEQTLYGGWPDSTALAWLERSTREITPVPGSRLRVFVR